MSNEIMSVPTSSVDQFVNALASLEASQRTNIPAPKQVRLNGNEGTFSAMQWDAEKKEMTFVPFGDNKNTEWYGTVLFTRYFAQWKFKEKARFKIRTREFSTFHEPIELLKIDNENKDAENETKTFANYAEFKKAYGVKDQMTDDIAYPFDFWCSVYVYVPLQDEVVNYRFKGDTRSNFFDWMNDYKQEGIKHMTELCVRFGQQEKQMPARDGQVAKTYFAGTFTTFNKNLEPVMLKIMQSFAYVQSWMKQYQNKPDAHATIEAEAIPTIQVEQDTIDLDSIPF